MVQQRYKVVRKTHRRPSLQSDVLEGLGRSEKLAGQLQPVLVDRYGNVVDGLHRLNVDSRWRTEKLGWVKTEKDRLVAKLHANYRRTVAGEELSKEFVKLADFLLRENKISDPRNAASAIAKLVPYTERYVRKILPSKYKRMEYANITEAEQVPPVLSRQEEEVTSKSEQAPSYVPQSARILARGILPIEWFTMGGARCVVNWEQRKIWVLPKS